MLSRRTIAFLFAAMFLLHACKDEVQSFDHARDIIIGEVLEKDSVSTAIRAFMLRDPLKRGDRVAPLGYPEKTITIDRRVWFCWVDHDYHADFAHSTQFIFLSVQKGALRVESQSWSPVLNDTIILWRDSADPEYDSAIIFQQSR